MNLKFKNALQKIHVSNICLGNEIEDQLDIIDLNEEIKISEEFDTEIFVSNPGIFIPELKTICLPAIVYENGMADWAGTAMFSVSEKGLSFKYLEQDPIGISCYNFFKQDISKMKCFVLENITEILNNSLIPMENPMGKEEIQKRIQIQENEFES